MIFDDLFGIYSQVYLEIIKLSSKRYVPIFLIGVVSRSVFDVAFDL